MCVLRSYFCSGQIDEILENNLYIYIYIKLPIASSHRLKWNPYADTSRKNTNNREFTCAIDNE